VLEVWLAREHTTAERLIGGNFSNHADVAIAFRLDGLWLAIIRSSHLSDAFFIREASSREGLDLPDSEREWDISALDDFQFSRTWIPVMSPNARHESP
jgi:hypothetical protein